MKRYSIQNEEKLILYNRQTSHIGIFYMNMVSKPDLQIYVIFKLKGLVMHKILSKLLKILYRISFGKCITMVTWDGWYDYNNGIKMARNLTSKIKKRRDH